MSAVQQVLVRQRRLEDETHLIKAGLHPLLARLLAARGIGTLPAENASALLAPDGLKGVRQAAQRIADAIAGHEHIVIVADYDCDGATACACAIRGLQAMGASVDYIVPDRLTMGYGLTPPVVDLAIKTGRERGRPPRLMITVDNGIASVEGVDHAVASGLEVIVTDHHLPGQSLPLARAIVNPNQTACTFKSKAMAGVGVMFYVLLAVRAELRRRGTFTAVNQPRLDTLLDLVALGTIADLAPLDANNRLLVRLGLERLRNGQAQEGIAAIARVGGRELRSMDCADLGFVVGPRINAAGRISDMALGIECLITDDPARAFELACRLNELNAERRQMQEKMTEEAQISLADSLAAELNLTGHVERAIVVFDASFHAGVVGLLASRLKEKHHLPTIVFAPNAEGGLQGSGRSIAGFHLRDAIDLAAKRLPGAVLRFGGHAMAAGVTLHPGTLKAFEAAFKEIAKAWISEAQATRTIVVDGPIETGYIQPGIVQLLGQQVWGQAFDPPLFSDKWKVLSQRVLKERHLKLLLEKDGKRFDAIAFGRNDPVGDEAHLAFRVALNNYQGVNSAQLIVEHVL
jgi:single-stranded-DNA-specific exonuclease